MGTGDRIGSRVSAAKSRKAVLDAFLRYKFKEKREGIQDGFGVCGI